MKKKHIAAGGGILLLVVAGLTYHLVFGFVQPTQIDDRIILLTRKNVLNQIGANVVIHTDGEETLVIDTQLPALASLTRSKIDALASSPITKVLITHWHPDHSGGISAFSGDADIIAHENVKHRLSAPQEGFGLTKPGSHHEFAARAADGLPNQTVSSRLELPIASSKIDVVHYSQAHTDGDLVVYFHHSQIAVIGDLIWPNSFPYVDVHNGGSVRGLESALRSVLAASKPGYRFIPGHGSALTFEDVARYLEMVTQTRHWVEARLQEGQTVDQIAASGVPDQWKVWSSPLVPSAIWMQMIHASWDIATAAKQ